MFIVSNIVNKKLYKFIEGQIISLAYYSKAKAVIPRKKFLSLESELAQSKHFVDFKKMRLFGGNGGNGCRSFLSIFGNEWAGPDGGDGGHGGHIIFQASSNITSLSHLKSIYRGNKGQNGQSKHCHGKNADSTIIQVPVGIFFRDEEGKIIDDLSQEKDQYLGARGGAGGKGNYFYLSNDNRAPTTYEVGGLGENKSIFAELRIIADIGLIGLPNVGKSSLLRALTRARPKIAHYPFTTLFPHVGVIDYDDYVQITVADIPGLIEDAHLNKGLGFSFLRHIEQCKTLVYVLDLTYHNPLTQLEILKYELEKYKIGMTSKPYLIVANKIDNILGEKIYREEVMSHVDSKNILPISAKEGKNIDILFGKLRQLCDNHINSINR